MLPPLGKRAGRLTGGKATLFLVCLATPVVDAKMVEVLVYVAKWVVQFWLNGWDMHKTAGLRGSSLSYHYITVVSKYVQCAILVTQRKVMQR